MKRFLISSILALCLAPALADSNITADIAVIGAGGAGLSAAVEAANLGAKVIVIEKAKNIGGNTLLAEGGINAGGTPIQSVAGIDDSVELAYYDTMKSGHWINDPELVRTLVSNAPVSIEWLMALGADLKEVGLMAGVSKARSHRPSNGKPAGPEIIRTLFNAAKDRHVDIRTNARVTRILSEKGRVTGLVVKGKKGIYTVNAKAVVNAAGGFSANNEMIAKYAPHLKGFATTGTGGSTGDGIRLTERLDAATLHMDRIQTHPTVEPKTSTMISEALRGNGGILINRNGKRFANELDDRDALSLAILKQPGNAAYLIFDNRIRESLDITKNYVNEDYCLKADSPEELASLMHVDPKVFLETIDLYRKEVQSDRYLPTKIGEPALLSTEPYYAIRVMPAIHHTMGGLKIDSRARVLDRSGDPIPGLFAAGEVTGGIHGANRLGGNALSDAVVFGRIAGREAFVYSQQTSE